MKRNQAIEKLALKKLEDLTEDERSEQLEIMTMENWSKSENWKLLPKEIRNEFENRMPIENPNAEKYNQILLIWLKEGLQSVTNKYLRDKLGVESIVGKPVKLESCPCCGSRTIGERGNYEICKICWWEDDGQDNESANKVFGGPNYGISLTQGRYNFLKFGIYDPKREDLMKDREPISKYEKGREFEISGGYVIERSKNWKGKIRTNA